MLVYDGVANIYICTPRMARRLPGGLFYVCLRQTGVLDGRVHFRRHDQRGPQQGQHGDGEQDGGDDERRHLSPPNSMTSMGPLSMSQSLQQFHDDDKIDHRRPGQQPPRPVVVASATESPPPFPHLHICQRSCLDGGSVCSYTAPCERLFVHPLGGSPPVSPPVVPGLAAPAPRLWVRRMGNHHRAHGRLLSHPHGWAPHTALRRR